VSARFTGEFPTTRIGPLVRSEDLAWFDRRKPLPRIGPSTAPAVARDAPRPESINIDSVAGSLSIALMTVRMTHHFSDLGHTGLTSSIRHTGPPL